MKTSIYVLIEFCLQWSQLLGPLGENKVAFTKNYGEKVNLQEIIGFINETCFKISVTSDGNPAELEEKRKILSNRRILMKLCDDNCKKGGKPEHCSW